jgi:hypothetical protein
MTQVPLPNPSAESSQHLRRYIGRPNVFPSYCSVLDCWGAKLSTLEAVNVRE